MLLKEGIHFKLLPTKKFKDIGISIRFNSELAAKSACVRSLLALMMGDRCALYDTKEKMNSHTDLLYGAALQTQTMGYGASHVLEISLKTIHPMYCNDEQYLEDVFAFLQEIIFHPLLTETVFLEAKNILKAKIKRNNDDPMQYVISQALKIAGKDQPLAISSIGELAILDEITLDDVIDEYNKVINENDVHIMICGDVHEDLVLDYVNKYFNFIPRIKNVKTYYHVETDSFAEYVEEYRNISQTSIMMVYFTNTTINDSDYYALRVANAILGQFPTSMLFQEVREKNSLCYSIFSNLIAFDGALGVVTGIEQENINKTIGLIEQQVKRVKDGDFDELLLKTSKDMIINSLRSSNDYMKSIFALEYQNTLLHRNENIDDLICKVKMVTKDDVIKVMDKCVHKLTFVLTKEGDCIEKDCE